jgi:hypothetical protein
MVHSLQRYCSGNQEHSFIDVSTALIMHLYLERVDLTPNDKPSGI